jgi:hypothetical protein
LAGALKTNRFTPSHNTLSLHIFLLQPYRFRLSSRGLFQTFRSRFSGLQDKQLRFTTPHPPNQKKLRDATDARSLADDLSSKGPIILSQTPKNAVLQGLDDVVRLSGKDQAWWKAKLALR